MGTDRGSKWHEVESDVIEKEQEMFRLGVSESVSSPMTVCETDEVLTHFQVCCVHDAMSDFKTQETNDSCTPTNALFDDMRSTDTDRFLLWQ